MKSSSTWNKTGKTNCNRPPYLPDDSLKSTTWIMLGSFVGCIAKLSVTLGFCINPLLGDKDYGIALNIGICGIPPIGVLASVIGCVAYARSARTFGFRLLLAVYIATILLDSFVFIAIGIRGVGMG